MADQVARALDALSRRDLFTGADELVFPNPTGGFLDDSALRRRYYNALKAAGIAHLRFHDLRHTFGTLAVQEFPLSDVKAYMGHADIATTMIYVHHVPQHDAADRLSARLARASTAAAALDRAVQAPTTSARHRAPAFASLRERPFHAIPALWERELLARVRSTPESVW